MQYKQSKSTRAYMLTVKIFTRSEKLPELSQSNFFHSTELFHIIEKTPGQSPYMAVASNGSGKIVGHMLAVLRRRGSWFPPYIFTQGRIYGEGEYTEEVNKEEVFGVLLKSITRQFRRKLCFFIEMSDLSQKMFGYKHLRRNKYFPIHWQEIHNSLHSKSPEERLSGRMMKGITKSYRMGVETREAENEADVHAFYKMLSGFYRMKMRRLIPPESQFAELHNSENAKIFITIYKEKVIGGCACAYSEGNAYMWYLASKRKSHPLIHPDRMTIWKALRHAYEHNYAHMFFLDVGLPFRKNRFRDFILSFGGKPVARYRWFRFSVSWLNRLLSWWYRE